MNAKRFGRVARKSLLRLTVLLVVAMVVIRFTGAAESMFFYVPTRKAYQSPPGVQEVSFQTADGLTLSGWYLPPQGWKAGDKPAPAVLFCHGNAGSLPNHLSFVEFLTRRGLGVFMFDYRSYGRSQAGRLVRENLALDTEAALAALKARPDVDPSRLAVYGFSLGGTFAVNLAAAHPELRAVCVAAAFSSWSGVASDHVPVLGSVMVGGGVDSGSLAARIGKRPVFIVHAEGDRTVGSRHAALIEAGAKAGGADVKLMIVPGNAHSRLILDHPDVSEAIGAFLAGNLGVS